jgi:hypothetical protein
MKMMSNINRQIVLNSLIKHETLTIEDIGKKENLGIVPDKIDLNSLLEELMEGGYISDLDGVVPVTYTITSKGIEEGERLNEKI